MRLEDIVGDKVQSNVSVLRVALHRLCQQQLDVSLVGQLITEQLFHHLVLRIDGRSL